MVKTDLQLVAINLQNIDTGSEEWIGELGANFHDFVFTENLTMRWLHAVLVGRTGLGGSR